jgi:hypothetical protein
MFKKSQSEKKNLQMPGRIKLTVEVMALINHLARHHGYSLRISAADIYREIVRSYEISERTVQGCLAESRRAGHATAKTGRSGRICLCQKRLSDQKGTQHQRSYCWIALNKCADLLRHRVSNGVHTNRCAKSYELCAVKKWSRVFQQFVQCSICHFDVTKTLINHG